MGSGLSFERMYLLRAPPREICGISLEPSTVPRYSTSRDPAHALFVIIICERCQNQLGQPISPGAIVSRPDKTMEDRHQGFGHLSVAIPSWRYRFQHSGNSPSGKRS